MPLLDDKFWRDIQQGLTDAGNRGIVGGTLGAPVDLAAGVINAALMSGGYLGNKLGLLTADQMPQPIEHPVGGSEWLGQKMQDAGMVSENRNPVAETLMGLLGPSAINKGGQAVWAMEQNAAKPSLLNDAARGQLGAIVYHGSPHKFDAFDMSKIGTGEGAQAYGHGMYFADAPEVARNYKNPGGPRSGTAPLRIDDIDAARWMQSQANTDIERRAASSLARNRNTEYAIDYLKQDAEYDPVAKAAAEWIQKNDARINKPGLLYKVDLPDEHIAKMLDWDKPLAQQSAAVQAALNRVVDTKFGAGFYRKWLKEADPDYRDLRNNLFENVDEAEISRLLHKEGVPGIRYLDAGSRAKGEGSYNYVVFDDQLPQIIGKE